MANDKPTSLRMGFGYNQARRAGLDGLREARSPRQVNRIYRERKEGKELVDELQRRAANDPDFGRLIVHRLREGVTLEDIYTEIYWIDRFAFWRIKKRFSLDRCLKRHWYSSV